MKYYLFILLLLVPFLGCEVKENNENENTGADTTTVIIDEVYQTARDTVDNIDSPAFWKNDTTAWLIATAKSTDLLYVYDAETGETIKTVGGTGTEPGKLKRPNGIWVINDMCIVVERDNHRVQIFSLPEFESLGTFGEEDLMLPYGLYVYQPDEASYHIYVTDCYEFEEDVIPPDSLLDMRVHHYEFTFTDDGLSAQLLKKFGATEGDGVLNTVESVFGNPDQNILLLSEEDESQSSVKVYDFNGNFTGEVFGLGLFTGQVEGLAWLDCGDGKGYWFVTDQTHTANRFLIFSGKDRKYIGKFNAPKTTNTDGIWLTQEPFGNFTDGAFFAVHDDGGVSALDLKTIKEKMKLDCK